MFEKFQALLQKNGNLVIILFTVTVIIVFILFGDQLPKMVIANNTTVNNTGTMENHAQTAYLSMIAQYNYTNKTCDNTSTVYPVNRTGNCSSYNCTVHTYAMPDTVGVVGVK